MTRPGVRVRALAARWCSAKTMERLIDPAIADLQVEYEDALRQGSRWRARRAWIAGHWALVTAVAWHAASVMARSLSALTVDDWRIVIRTSAFALLASGLFVVALSAPPVLHELSRVGTDSWPLVPYMLPQTVPFAIPLGIPFAIVIGAKRRGISQGLRALVLLLAVLASVASFASLSWLLPAAGQAYRVAVAQQASAGSRAVWISRGPNEMTLAELRDAVVVKRQQGELFALRNAVWRLELTYHRRFALASAPLVLAIVALAVVHRLGDRQKLAIWVNCSAVTAYWLFMYAAERSHAAPAIVAWAPTVTILALTMAIARLVPPPADVRPISA